ncbi:sugar transferase [Bacillus sp. FJAT-26390]|uniref:sugar transferase n=1 Tax=Bacillus sp. FJAT-26390 TaxID=1743142 RepID=UPI000808020F|nr:sugar transferase [Bacillus sp. FJAT-26390]OBZ11232.1 capsular biosynthesis protein [Bacillus sp. FJAT-26390]
MRLNYQIYKRVFDFLIASVSLIVLLPFFLVLIVIIKIDSKGPIFFKQKRIGKNKKEFYILKFRTMRFDTPKDTPTHLLKNPELYITSIGRLLRKSSLDELPQVLNILKGEMSIIGPRPALWNQYDLIAQRDLYGANDVYPGLTGWAQVNGRDELTVEAKAKFDGHYIENMSLLFDIQVFLMTIASVIRSEGIKEGSTQHSRERAPL